MKRVVVATVIAAAGVSMFGFFKKAKPPRPSAIEPTPAAREEAKRKPNGWVYMIEGNYDPQDAVPPEAIKGAWKVDGNGEIVGDFMPNPNYRPSVPTK